MTSRPDDGPCAKPDPVEVRKVERALRRNHFYANTGFLAVIGWLALLTMAITDTRMPFGTRWAIGAYATYCAMTWTGLFFGSLRLVRDRNFWRKQATHDLDQLHAAVMRDINEGEGWKR